MNEWGYLLATFWGFWLADGLQWARNRSWSFGTGLIPGRVGLRFDAWHFRPPSPAGWRALSTEIPFALSPAGLCNRPVAAAGRPSDAPHVASACRWEDLRQANVAGGWVMINGHRFCRDTGHVTPPELLALASMTVEARAAAIRGLLSRWMRPLHLRRHVAVLRGRTRGCAIANTWGLLAAAMLSAFALVAPTGVLTDETLATLAAFVPPLAIVFFGAHLAGVLFAWRALRRCPPRPTSKPDTRLVSAALFPPQALRLRMLVGERSFRPQHPLAYALAFAAYPERRQIAFDTVADLHWPVGEENDPPGAKEVSAWCRHLWLEVLAEPLAAAGLSLDELQAPPSPIGRAACRYCPRCGDQFASDTGRCPHGVPLRPLTNATRATTLGQ